MSYIVVDVEADGEIPHDYSMVCFGAVVVEPSLSKTFYGKTKPISKNWKPDALAISGFSREEHETFDDPALVMEEFARWIVANTQGSPIFISDNLAFDWSFINWYMHHFLGRNPFGWSGRRIGDLYCGMVKDSRAKWKFLRSTKHSHHPVDDAKGNAEALLKIKEMGLKISFV
jgi:DNA polymerase III epsilon subunit-like protein